MSVDKLVDSTQLDSDLTSVANAIRTKGGTSSQLAFPSGFVSAINNIPTGGGSTLITKNIGANGTYNASSDSADGYSQVTVAVPNSYSQSDEGKVVSNGALVAQTSDTVTQNDTYDTTLINSLTVNVSGGGGVSLDDVASKSLSGALTLSTATLIGTWAFYGMNDITSFASDSVLQINGGAFRECRGLTSISFPNCTTFSGNDGVFYDAVALTNVYLPKVSSALPNYAFRGCTSLVNLALPEGTSVYTQVFDGCSNLEKLDMGGNGGSLSANSLKNAPKLNVLVLRSTSVKGLANINAFDNTCFAYGKAGGTLYVPNSLISSYQSASNWSTILGYANNSIQKIEGTIYETKYADGTTIPTT